jgi:hypothetical protein
MDLLMYSGKRIAVVLNHGGAHRVFCGLATLAQDHALGVILKIPLQQGGRDLEGEPTFIVQNEVIGDYLVADDRYGCDFRLDLGSGGGFERGIGQSSMLVN